MVKDYLDPKEKRRRSLLRKRLDKLQRINPVAKELRTPKFRKRVIETKEKGGSKNLLQNLNLNEDI